MFPTLCGSLCSPIYLFRLQDWFIRIMNSCSSPWASSKSSSRPSTISASASGSSATLFSMIWSILNGSNMPSKSRAIAPDMPQLVAFVTSYFKSGAIRRIGRSYLRSGKSSSWAGMSLSHPSVVKTSNQPSSEVLVPLLLPYNGFCPNECILHSSRPHCLKSCVERCI